jgi:hypothetical protein
VFNIRGAECKLIRQADWAANVWIEGIAYETSYSVRDVIEFISENIPELHAAAQLSEAREN